LAGIRLDSGDLAWLAKEARRMLDEAGLHYVKIVASNQLDEYVIKSVLEQGAPVDIFGVGTKLVTGYPDGALDGVYKLSMAGGKPRLKISETIQKTTLPGVKQVLRVLDDNGQFFGADAVVLDEETEADIICNPFEPGQSLSVGKYKKETMLVKVMENGKRVIPEQSITDIRAYAQKRLALLPAEYKRFEFPHIYKTSVSKKLLDLREKMIEEHKHHFDENADNS
jgi:nicotinate phosphoribosyltransferase